MLSDEDDGNAYQQGQDDTDPNDLKQVPNSFSSGRQLAPTRNLGGAKERADTVLQAMVDTGAITAEQAEAARVEPVNLRVPSEIPPGTNYFVDTAAADVRRLLGGASGDLTLRTTLDLELQRLAEGVIERRFDAEGQQRNVSQAALVALAPDGAVRALVWYRGVV